VTVNNQENAEAFSAAVEGIPRVVELITNLPREKQPAALLVAQESYLRMARTLGCQETEAQQWASMIISMLENWIWLKFISRLNSKTLIS
jgi:hypothetical protein